MNKIKRILDRNQREKWFTLGLVSSFFGLQSCYQEPEFSLVPEITFRSIEKEIRVDQFTGANKDSVIITLDFQDGDGDLGLSETEKAAAELRGDYNYVVRVFRQRNGVFQEFNPGIPYSGYFPQFRSDGRLGPIEGILSYSIDFPHPFTPRRDSLKFEIFIKDVAGNVSNTIETDVIVLNDLVIGN